MENLQPVIFSKVEKSKRYLVLLETYADRYDMADPSLSVMTGEEIIESLKTSFSIEEGQDETEFLKYCEEEMSSDGCDHYQVFEFIKSRYVR